MPSDALPPFPTDAEIVNAIMVLNSFEFFSDGTISRYPEPADHMRALNIVRRALGLA